MNFELKVRHAVVEGMQCVVCHMPRNTMEVHCQTHQLKVLVKMPFYVSYDLLVRCQQDRQKAASSE